MRQVPLKILSTKQRRERIRKKGGIDDSYITKKNMKGLGNTHVCQFCHKKMRFHAFNHRTGVILMTCDTGGCMGNAALEKGQWDRPFKDLHAKHIDRKLTFDLKHLLFGRDPKRQWAVKDRIW